MIRLPAVLALGALVVTSACSTGGLIGKRDTGADLVGQCLRETSAPGSYSFEAGQSAPVVRPDASQGGTQEGADQINACVRQNATAFGVVSDDSRVFTDPEPVPPVRRADPVSQPARQPTPVPQSPPLAPQPSGNPTCPPGVQGMYRGSLMC